VSTPTTATTTRSTAAAARRHRRPRPSGPPFAVGERIVTFVDPGRKIHLPGGALQQRKLVTLIRYPAQGSPAKVDAVDAPPARAAGPFPLVIFGHGFAVTPTPYAQLLRAWARAGYVVAAPIFPLENANAPGGPNESDLVNQPRDMSLVITRMLQASAVPGGFFAGLVDRRRIAVSGQSDGGETALAVAYDRYFIDRRVRAAIILSGAVIPGVSGFDFPSPSPPLLATQGTADTINPPSFTHAFYDIAPPPKYLLNMFGAPHLPPYTYEQPQLGIVERVTIAFMDRYVKGLPGALRRMLAAGDVSGVSAVQSDP
jgi:dienelactone hydrolase